MRNSKMFNQTLQAAKQLQGRMKDREGTQRKHNGENLEEDKKMFKNPKPLRKEGEWELGKLSVWEVKTDTEKDDLEEKEYWKVANERR